MTDPAPRMGSNRPYLLRALNEWINDNGMTPYLLVDAKSEGLQVPPSAVKDATEPSAWSSEGPACGPSPTSPVPGRSTSRCWSCTATTTRSCRSARRH